jgi:hypothetical protein
MPEEGCPEAPPAKGPLEKEGHTWRTVDARIEGSGSMSTYTVEQCTRCRDRRLNYDVEVIEEVGRDV